MSGRAGFPLVEIIVVSLVLSISLGIWLYVLSGTRQHSHKDRLVQELMNTRARLLAVLKGDLRSAIRVTKSGKDKWKLEAWQGKKGSPPVIRIITYNKLKTRVERECNGERKVFEFGEVLEGKKLVFNIQP